MKKYIPFISALLVVPALASAQLSGTEGLILRVLTLVEMLVTLVAACALLVFMWGLMKFIFKVGGDEEAIKEGKNLMKWGLIALFVMLSVWGIIRFLQGEFDLNNAPIDIVNILTS